MPEPTLLIFSLAECESVIFDQIFSLILFRIPLRLGYVPVVNRGQRDIDQSKAIAVALEAEKQFFENHGSYRAKAMYCGTPYLARKLNMVS